MTFVKHLNEQRRERSSAVPSTLQTYVENAKCQIDDFRKDEHFRSILAMPFDEPWPYSVESQLS